MIDSSIKEQGVGVNRETDALIEKLVRSIPEKDRSVAIVNASRKRERFLLNVWRGERSQLPKDLIAKYGLTDDMEGWMKYLRFIFDSASEFQKTMGLEEWSVKFTAQMLRTLADDASVLEWSGKKELLKVRKSYLEYHSKNPIFGLDLLYAGYKPIDPNSLLIHSISREALMEVIKSGVVGRNGQADVAMSQDRIIFDRGYIIAFQVNELVAAGYPLLQVNEDLRDYKILREWRSPIPIDIRLARLVVPTLDIQDRDKASRASIADSFFGEDYLRQIPRIK